MDRAIVRFPYTGKLFKPLVSFVEGYEYKEFNLLAGNVLGGGRVPKFPAKLHSMPLNSCIFIIEASWTGENYNGHVFARQKYP